MPRSRRVWTTLVFLLVLTIAGVDAFLRPAPRSSRRSAEASGEAASVSVLPPLRTSDAFPPNVFVQVGGDRKSLFQSGSYIRWRTVWIATIDFYEVASFIDHAPTGSKEAMLDSIWRDDGTKVYLLRFLISVPGWQLKKAVHDEIARSFDDVPREEHQQELDRLLTVFAGGASAGDVFYLARLPGNRLYIGFRDNQNLTLITQSERLCRAIWRMWAGPTAEPGREGLVENLVERSAAD